MSTLPEDRVVGQHVIDRAIKVVATFADGTEVVLKDRDSMRAAVTRREPTTAEWNVMQAVGQQIRTFLPNASPQEIHIIKNIVLATVMGANDLGVFK